MIERPVTLSLPNCADTAAHALIVERPPPVRLARAAIALVSLWGVGLVCVFIPLLHFVLVPAFAVLGPVVAAFRLTERVTLRAVRGACPRCRVERTFETSGRFKEGCRVHCDGCGNTMSLRSCPEVP